jgi:ANTAR domain-containing protein
VIGASRWALIAPWSGACANCSGMRRFGRVERKFRPLPSKQCRELRKRRLQTDLSGLTTAPTPEKRPRRGDAVRPFIGVGGTAPGDGVWLDHSVYGRAEIHQATGMVLVQLGANATDAVARMRAYAFAEQRSLSDVARDVVSRRLRFTQDMMWCRG